MPTYAQGTEVSAERSRAEIEKILRKWDVDAVALGWDREKAVVRFVHRGRQVRIDVPLPDIEDDAVVYTEARRVRAKSARAAALEKVTRERWRALVLTIKSLLAAVDAGILSFEDAFLAMTVLPSGATVRDHIDERITEAYATGEVPELLPPMRKAISA